MNVLPLVNHALAIFQWKQDIPAAEKLCHEALELDDECDAAVATLAQLSLQQGRLDEAIEMFERHAKISRTEAELIQALTYKNVSVHLFFLSFFLPHTVASLFYLLCLLVFLAD